MNHQYEGTSNTMDPKNEEEGEEVQQQQPKVEKKKKKKKKITTDKNVIIKKDKKKKKSKGGEEIINDNNNNNNEIMVMMKSSSVKKKVYMQREKFNNNRFAVDDGEEEEKRIRSLLFCVPNNNDDFWGLMMKGSSRIPSSSTTGFQESVLSYVWKENNKKEEEKKKKTKKKKYYDPTTIQIKEVTEKIVLQISFVNNNIMRFDPIDFIPNNPNNNTMHGSSAATSLGATKLKFLLVGIDNLLQSLLLVEQRQQNHHQQQQQHYHYPRDKIYLGGTWEGGSSNLFFVLFHAPNKMIQTIRNAMEYSSNHQLPLGNNMIITGIYSLFAAINENENQNILKLGKEATTTTTTKRNDIDFETFVEQIMQNRQHPIHRSMKSLESILQGLQQIDDTDTTNTTQFLFQEEIITTRGNGDDDNNNKIIVSSDFTAYKNNNNNNNDHDHDNDFTFLIPASIDCLKSLLENDIDYWYSIEQTMPSSPVTALPKTTIITAARPGGEEPLSHDHDGIAANRTPSDQFGGTNAAQAFTTTEQNMAPPGAAAAGNDVNIIIIPKAKNDLEAMRLEQGECPTCGMQTHEISSLGKKKPLNVEGEIYEGRCLLCYPLDNNYIRQRSAAQQQQQQNQQQQQQQQLQQTRQNPLEDTPLVIPVILEVPTDEDNWSVVSGITMDMQLIVDELDSLQGPNRRMASTESGDMDALQAPKRNIIMSMHPGPMVQNNNNNEPKKPPPPPPVPIGKRPDKSFGDHMPYRQVESIPTHGWDKVDDMMLNGIPAMLQRLNQDDASSNTREQALISLTEILRNSGEKARNSLVKNKCVETLVKTMWADMNEAKVQIAALDLLILLSASPDGQESGDVLSNEESVCDTLLFLMQCHISHPGIQLHGCAILACLASASSNNIRISDGSLSGSLLMVLNAMSHHRRLRDIQKVGLQSLYYLCLMSSNAESNKRTLLESTLDNGGTGMDAVLSAMTTLQDDVIAMEWACSLCWCLSSSQDLLKSLSATTVVDDISELCQMYTLSPDASALVEAAFGVIANLSYLESNRSKLENLGVVTCLVDGIHCHPNDHGVVIEACSAIANLGVSSHLRGAMVRSGAVDSVISALQTLGDDDDVLSEAIRALTCLAVGSIESKEAIATSHIIKSVVGIIKKRRAFHQSDGMACALIASLAAGNASLTDLIVRSGAMEAIFHLLSFPSSDEKAKDAVCLAYRNVACELDDSNQILERNAINNIVETMGKYGNSASIQMNSCCILWNLAYKGRREHGTIVQAEGIKNIVKAMQSHLESGELLELACGALWSLVDGSIDRKQDAVENGAIDVVSCAAIMHPGRVSTLEKAFGVLSSLSLERPYAEAIINAQGINILVETMRSNGSWVSVLEVGCTTLRNLIYHFPEYAPELSTVLSVVIDAMKEDNCETSFQREACNFLWVLAANAENCQSKILALDGVGILVKCMEIAEVQESALGAFRQLTSGNNNCDMIDEA